MSEAELRQRLAGFVGGDESLEDFDDWFSLASWNAHKDSSPGALRLVGAVELRLAEYSNGHLSYDELLHELELLAISQPVQRATSGNTVFITTVLVNMHDAVRTPPVLTGATRAERRVVPVPVPA